METTDVLAHGITMLDGSSPIGQKLPSSHAAQTQRFREFTLEGRVIVMTGGGQGLGLGSSHFLNGVNVCTLHLVLLMLRKRFAYESK